ncbi:putative OB-fold protein [Caballeronia udeis]|uniref:OB-fold protein n=1 Tax=Caballeronia udeis TaxID=1232866 RepID=A0ABW8MUK8_9BURK
MSLTVSSCIRCGTTVFPARYLCPVCGGAEWSEIEAARGTVTALTVVRHRVGAHNSGGVHLASVAMQAGPTVIACLKSVAEKGDAVCLALDEQHRIVASRS